MTNALSKLLHSLVILALGLITACQDKPDTVEDIGTPPPLDLLPIEITITPTPSPILKEELYGFWKITKLDEWKDGDFVAFTDDTTMFSFKCNNKSLFGEMSDEGLWHAPLGRFGTTEALCVGEKESQDEAMLTLMIGPTKIERIGDGSNTLRFFTDDHEMIIERKWRDGGKPDLTQDALVGKWDILRFDDYIPKTRLNGEGRRSAFVDFYDDKYSPGSLGTYLNIGCNFSGNALRLELGSSTPRLVHVPRDLDYVATEMGCPPILDRRDKLFFKMMYQSPKLERWGEHRLRLWTDNHELILEKTEYGQSRNLIKNYETIVGKWQIIMANKAGLGFGGHFSAPEPLIIAKDKIQYGDLTPYLKNPRIWRGKIEGEIIGDFGTRDCEANRLLSPDKLPPGAKNNAICFVLNTITGHPIADPINLPNLFQLTSGDYRITLQRSGTDRFTRPKPLTK